MERLTDKRLLPLVNKQVLLNSEKERDLYRGLCEIEDIMEKYHCDDIEHLEQKLELDLIHQNELCKLSYKLMSLECKLKDAIVPKFKVGQKVWAINKRWSLSKGNYYDITPTQVEWFKVYRVNKNQNKVSIGYRCFITTHSKTHFIPEKNLFSSKEEAEKKLEEISNV